MFFYFSSIFELFNFECYFFSRKEEWDFFNFSLSLTSLALEIECFDDELTLFLGLFDWFLFLVDCWEISYFFSLLIFLYFLFIPLVYLLSDLYRGFLLLNYVVEQAFSSCSEIRSDFIFLTSPLFPPSFFNFFYMKFFFESNSLHSPGIFLNLSKLVLFSYLFWLNFFIWKFLRLS